MPEKPWKQAERQVAQRLGGQRVKRHGEATSDVVTPHLVAEVILRKRLPRWILYAVNDAKAFAGARRLPIAVLKDMTYDKTLVVMDLSDFQAWFGPITAKKEAP